MNLQNIITKWFGSPENKTTNEKAPLNQYVKTFTSRSTQDIKKWREAIQEAENFSQKFRVKMQNIYKDTVLNGHVRAAINKRKNITLQQEFEFLDLKGEKLEEMNQFFNKKWFQDILEYTLDSKFYGYSLINWPTIKDGIPSNIQIISRENIVPDLRVISSYPYNQQGKSIDDPELDLFSMYCDTKNEHGLSVCGYGLLYEVANYEIILRHLMGYNSTFAEKYGQPITIVDTMKTSDDERQFLEDMIINLGSAGFMIKDPGDTVSYLEYSSVGDGFQVYSDLEKRCESKISKILLGHADALDSTPGKLGSNTELSPAQIALMEIKTNDSNYIEYFVNDVLIPKLRKMGNNIPSGRWLFCNNEQKELKKELEMNYRIKMSEFIRNNAKSGIKIDIDWLSNELNMPLTYGPIKKV